LTRRTSSHNQRSSNGPGEPAVRVFPNLSNRLAYHYQMFLPVGFDAYCREAARAVDVAHLHAFRNGPGVIAARHLQRAGNPYVLAPNGTGPRIERRFVAKRIFDAAAGTRVLDGAARVIAVSNAEREQFAAMHIVADRVRMVPNPIDLDEFSDVRTRGRFR